MIDERKHRVNETTVATLTGSTVAIYQRDSIDDATTHLSFLTLDELRKLIAVMDAD